MLKKLVSIGSAAAALIAPLAVTAPAQASEPPVSSNIQLPLRCELKLIEAGPGAYDTCNYSALSLNGEAFYTAIEGQATLTVQCTVGGFTATVGTGTRGYTQIGTCTAVLYTSPRQEVLTTAIADVGNSGV